MQFEQDWPKDKKNNSSFNFLAENLKKFRSNELYGAALEGSTIFLCRSSTCRMSMETCQLPDWESSRIREFKCEISPG